MAEASFNPITIYHEKVCVKVADNKGRGLFATCPLKEGDQVLIERPLISCQFSWNKLYYYIACDHCLKSLETAENMARRLTGTLDLELMHKECCEAEKAQLIYTQCPSCSVPYCCEECRQEAYDSYHKILCLGDGKDDKEHPFNKLDEVWRTMHYPPETTSIWLVCRMIASVLQAENPDQMLAAYSSFCSSPINSRDKMAHKVLGDNFKDKLEVLRSILSETIYNEKVECWFTPDGFLSLLAMLGMNGQGIGTSSLSQYVHNVDSLRMDDDERKYVDARIDKLYEDIDKESGQFVNCEGSGLYVIQSACNHSCEPNAEVTFPYNNSTLVLVAMTDIAENEEICISYLDECQRNRSRHSRQKILRENYIFHCTCALCELQSDTADVTSSEEEDDSDMSS